MWDLPLALASFQWRAFLSRPRLSSRFYLGKGLATDLPRGAPEAQGLASVGLLKFTEALDKDIDQMNSVMLVRHGRRMVGAVRRAVAHSLYSLSKSFTSAVGVAIADWKLVETNVGLGATEEPTLIGKAQ